MNLRKLLNIRKIFDFDGVCTKSIENKEKQYTIKEMEKQIKELTKENNRMKKTTSS